MWHCQPFLVPSNMELSSIRMLFLCFPLHDAFDVGCWCRTFIKTELAVPCPTFQTIEEQIISPSRGFAWQSLKCGCSWSILFCKCWVPPADFKEHSVFLWQRQYWDFYCHLECNSRQFMGESCVVRRAFWRCLLHQIKGLCCVSARHRSRFRLA